VSEAGRRQEAAEAEVEARAQALAQAERAVAAARRGMEWREAEAQAKAQVEAKPEAGRGAGARHRRGADVSEAGRRQEAAEAEVEARAQALAQAGGAECEEEVEAEAEAGVDADPGAEAEACYMGWVWLEDAWHLLGLGPRTTAGASQRNAASLQTASWARAWRARRQRVGSEEEAGRRRAAVMEARRRRRAEAKAGRKRAFEAAAARAAAVGRTAVERAAAKRAAAERGRVVAAISALEWRAAAEWSASCDTLAAVFEGVGGDGHGALSSAGRGPGPQGGSSEADVDCAGAPVLRCCAGGCGCMPGRGRRRPHMRWRARRESYYIRRSPPGLCCSSLGGGS
jgi:hypothetical protein